ncbi:ribonuclease J [Candidatus Saccharibacteria bacterium]|nr:ribonuclease J [Candidatus Saccharibacteria bacterium]
MTNNQPNIDRAKLADLDKYLAAKTAESTKSAQTRPARPTQKQNREAARRAKLMAMRDRKLKDMKSRGPSNTPEKTKADKNKINLSTTTRRGEMVRAQRMMSQDVNARATQHIVNIPVNKSEFNGFKGQQPSPAQLRTVKPSKEAVRIIPLGGVGDTGIGKNMTLIEYGDESIVIDMGVMFAGDDYPGVNYLIPDIKYLERRLSTVKAILFTHAHLDHIGAARHLLPRFHHLTPIYGTEFTLNMVKKQMNELAEVPELNYVSVDPAKHEQIQVSPNLSVEFISTTHSIPGNASFIIRTPAGTIAYMGDWRFEEKPVSTPFDIGRFEEIRDKEGIDLLINESTNINIPGAHAHSEFDVSDNIGKVMDNFPNGRIIISSFSSQIARIQLTLEEAQKRGRKVAFAGFSMINNLETALRSKEIKVPKDTIMKMEDIVKLPDNKVTIVCTGSQGELNAVLNRMASGSHKFIKIKPTDIIVFSSSPVPGNEVNVVHTVDGLTREGAEVIRHGNTHLTGVGPLHLSGHAYYEDHVKLLELLKPKLYLPVHGTFSMLESNADMAVNIAGIKKEDTLVIDNGDTVEFFPNKTIKRGIRINVGSELYDNSNNRVHEAVVKDRLHISNEGIFIIVLTLNKKTGRLIKTPDVVSRAFVYLDDSEELIGKIRHYLRTKTDRIGPGEVDLSTLKQEIKDDISHILYDTTGHTPIVIPVVNKV